MNYYSTITDDVKHSAAHILAMAVSEVFPGVRIGIGPVTKTGFYYDFEISEELTPDIVSQILEKTKEIEKENLPFRQILLNRQAAQNMLMQKGQAYKAELLNMIPDDEVSFYKTGETFVDLCRGPHVNSTSEVGPIIITKIEDVHWNEDPARPILKRIHGMTFRNENEIGEYQSMQKQKEERDFMKISIQDGYFAKNNNKVLTITDKGALVMDRFRKAIYKYVLTDESIELPLFFVPKSAEEISIAADIAALTNPRSKQEYPLEMFIFTQCVNLKVKDTKQPSSNVFFFKNYQTDSGLVLGLEKVEHIIKTLLIDNSSLYIDLEYKDSEDPLFNSISKILQKNLISHTKLISTDREEITLKIKAKDSLEREWDIATVKVYNKAFTTSTGVEVHMIEYFVNLLNLMAYHLEDTNGELTRDTSAYELIIVPLKKKHMTYALDFKKKVNAEGYSAKVLFTTKSLNNRIKIAENSNARVIAIIGDNEIENGTINARINKNNHGLMKIEDLFKYLLKGK
ncbi:MAG: His/Gly/Thr/Pro-type tRNA ligase C-terminal domain-containing protein [Candidatus Dojkabacteria bacterium]